MIRPEQEAIAPRAISRDNRVFVPRSFGAAVDGVTLDTAANSVLFDYSGSPVAPNINWSQPGGVSGIP